MHRVNTICFGTGVQHWYVGEIFNRASPVK
jgi:hypothetical protein